jgi:repressor LexA
MHAGGVYMQHKDPDLMKRINTYIGEFYLSHDRTPSTTEIAKDFGISRSSAQRYLVAMNEKGMLSYQGGRLSIDKMNKLRTDRQQAPLVGSIPCGELTYEEENVECVTTLPMAIFGTGPFYILHASGDSMEDEGIENDDLVVIRQEAAAPKKGDLVIALNEEGQSTLKKYGGRDRKTGKAILEYCNKAVYGNKRILVKDLVCQGIVSHVIKQK